MDNAESVLYVSGNENRAIFNQVVEGSDGEMSNVLLELVRPQVDTIVNEATIATARTAVEKMFQHGASYELGRVTFSSDILSDEELQAIYNQVVCTPEK